jgi:hypothetical protein
MDYIGIDDFGKDEFLTNEDDLLDNFMVDADELLDFGDIANFGKEVIET